MKKNKITKIWQYLLGDLDEYEVQEFEKQLKELPRLAEEFERQKDIYDSLAKTEVIEFRKTLMEMNQQIISENRKRYLRKNVLWISAAASIVILAGLFFVFKSVKDNRQLNGPDSERLITETGSGGRINHSFQDSLKGQEKDLKFLKPGDGQSGEATAQITRYGKPGNGEYENVIYEANPILEGLVENSYRSWSLQVRSPAQGQEFGTGEPVAFRWRLDAAEAVTLVILNNRAAQVFDTVVTKSRFHNKYYFPPGLYYWKIQSDEEIVFIGKFKVLK